MEDYNPLLSPPFFLSMQPKKIYFVTILIVLLIAILTLIAVIIELKYDEKIGIKNAQNYCGKNKCIIENYSEFKSYCDKKYQSWKLQQSYQSLKHGIYYRGYIPNHYYSEPHFYFDTLNYPYFPYSWCIKN